MRHNDFHHSQKRTEPDICGLFSESAAELATHGAESRRLERRAQAWTILTLPADLRAAAVVAADGWFALTAAEQAEAVAVWPESLRVAYDVGRSNVARATASAVLPEWLLRWIYSAGWPEPEPFSVGQYLLMLVDPAHPDAAMLRAFRSYAIAERRSEES